MSGGNRINPAGLHQHAMALFQTGQQAQAVALWRNILAADARHADSHFMLAVVALQSGRIELALQGFDQAIALRPRDARFHDHRGDALAALGRMPEATEAWRTAVRQDPKALAPMVSLGTALIEAERLDEALVWFRKAVALAPKDVAALNGVGQVLGLQHRFQEAEAALRAALKQAPDTPAVLNNLATVLRDSGRVAEAEATLGTALRLDPGNPALLFNLALNRIALLRWQDAEALLLDVLRLRPDHADAHYFMAVVCFATDRSHEAWDHYEWRTRLSGRAPRLSEPNWDGADLQGRTLLVRADEGYGDFLQFCRFVPLAAKQGRVLVEVPLPLVRLALRLPGVSQVIPSGQALPACDLHCSATSLPRAFKVTKSAIPADVPYLSADRHDIADWRARLADMPGLKVGMVWGGNATQRVDAIRSLPFEALAPLADVAGACLISLQKDRLPGCLPGLTLHDWTRDLLDFADTAALIAELDLVISVDTAVAHLAGAIGHPVWLLNRWDGDSDPRWLTGGSGTPWYPTMRIFRQKTRGDWTKVIHDVAAALREAAHGR